MATRALKAGTTICLALLVASCGGNSAPAAEKPAPGQPRSESPADPPAATRATQASALPDPCALLTDNEINEVLRPTNNGYKVSARKFIPFPDIGGGQCDIEVKNSSGFASTFSISVSPEDKGSLFVEKGARKPIPDMGPEAFEVRFNYYVATKGILLHVVDVPGDRQRGAAALLRAAMAKL
jgi:hypothetical protein